MSKNIDPNAKNVNKFELKISKEEQKKIESLIKDFCEELAVDGNVFIMRFSRIIRRKDRFFALFEIEKKES